MDRNSAIGLTLIAAILLVYFGWFAAPPAPPATQPEPAGRTVEPDTVVNTPRVLQNDSALAATYGDFSTYLRGEETPTLIETEDLKILFSNRGGIIRDLELKKYRTYHQQPLKLIDPRSTTFRLLSTFQNHPIDLYTLFYSTDIRKVADTTVVTFRISLGSTAHLTQTYTIPPTGFEIGYSISSEGVDRQLGSDNITFVWNNFLRPLEKDLADSRNNTTVTYYTANDSFDELAARSSSTEREIITSPVKWVTLKQKFFLASIIANEPFAGGEMETAFDAADTSIVKRANVSLTIPKNRISSSHYKFYFGPNDYQLIGSVAEQFKKNVYLGWPPVYWINKFVIFPVFHLLTQFISNYGLIIIILVLLLKLVLAPLSYRSYLSMAKMKVLKPELDEIKEKYGDDMTKAQQEQMKLYQQVGVNPISGCIPVLLQMPILFAMFYLFPASIELRQQPFLWAEDLSTYDSIINLPFTIPFYGSHVSLFTLLMTISTLIYTWQNNQLSSVQGPMKSMSYIMPLILIFVLNSFSAGLTFYYLVSNLVTFAQQAIIRRFVDDNKIRATLEENKKRNAAGGGKKSKFMSRLEEAMKASEQARKTSEETKRKRKK